MPVFGRGFPSKFRPFGVIAGASLEISETITNTAVASQSITLERLSETGSQSGNATQALTVEATREPNKDNSATSSQSFALDATVETENNSASNSQTITLERLSETDTNSSNSSQTLTSAEAQAAGNSGSATQALAVDAIAETKLNRSGRDYTSVVLDDTPWLYWKMDDPDVTTGATASFETGVNGATISTSDPGSSTPWDSINLNSAPLYYDNTHVAIGSMAAKLEATGASGGPQLRWTSGLNGPLSDYYFRIYIWLPNLPSSFIYPFDAYLGGNHSWRIDIKSDGHLQITDRAFSGSFLTSTNALNVGAWNKIEGHVDHASSFFEYKLFLDADSPTPTETQNMTSGVGYLTGIDEVLISLGSLSPTAAWYDGIVMGATIYPHKAKDYSGNNRIGTYYRSPIVKKAGVIGDGNSVYFGGNNYDSTDAYLISDSAIFNSTESTMEIWFDYDGSLPTSGERLYIAGLAEGIGGTITDKIIYINDTGQIGYYNYPSGGFEVESSSALTIGRHHIVGIVSVTGSLLALYVDGVLVDSYSPIADSYASYTNPNVLVGGHSGSHALQTVVGRRDEFALYTYALTPTQILDHYRAGPGNQTILQSIAETLTNSATSSQTLTGEQATETINNSGSSSNALTVEATSETVRNGKNDYTTTVLADSPLGYWRLGESAGLTAEDSSGNDRDGEYNNSPTLGVSGLLADNSDTAVDFTGTDSSALLGNPAAFQITSGTLEAWISTTDNRSSHHCIIAKQHVAGLFLVSGELIAYDWGAGTNRWTGINIADGLTHHVALVFDSGVTNGSIIYLDGLPVLTTTITVAAQDAQLDISAGSAGQYIDAIIDEAAIYGTMLSPARIAEHYASGTSSSSSSPESTQAIDEEIQVAATADTLDNVGVASHSLSESHAEGENNGGTGSPSTGEAIAEVVTNQGGVASGGAYGSGAYGSGPYGGIGAGENQTIIEAIAETPQNSATNTQTLTDVESDTSGNTGTGTHTIAEATSESIGSSATATHTIGDAQPEPDMTNVGSGSQTTSESIAETVSNSATSDQTITTTEVASEQNTGTGTHTFTEAIAESVLNSATNEPLLTDIVQEAGEQLDNTNVGTHSIYEVIAESPQNSAVATIVITDAQTEEEANTGTGSSTIAEATAESVGNSATASQSITDQIPETNLTSVGTGTQYVTEVIVEPIVVNTQASTQTFAEALADTEASSGTSTHTLTDVESDTPTNGGNGAPSIGEATAETDSNSGTNEPEYDESVHIRVVPFSDITTGTWTVTPLYEKVDEFYPISGYPTESIRSASNPVNDTAVLGLTPVSDPGIDTEHYINIQFWKHGAETLDFIVNLKDGNTIIATRTFTNVTETESNPRVEKIALTNLEASAIVDYSNLNIELIANQTS